MKSAFQEKRPKIPELLREIRDALRAVLTKHAPAPIVNVAAPIVKPPDVSVSVAQPPKCGFTCEVTAYREDGRIKTFTITPH